MTTFKTSGDHEVEIKEYMTARESREVQKIFLEQMQMGVEDGKAKIENVPTDISLKAQDKTLEILVVKLDGKDEDILNRLLGLPKQDFEEIIAEIDKMDNPEKKTK